MSSRTTALTIAGLSVCGLVAYAAYFDYKRRTDAAFRKTLKKQKKRVDKSLAQSKQAAEAAAYVTDAQLAEALKSIKSQPPPATREAQEAHFMEQISMGEQLSVTGEAFYLPAALAFYRALTVYPSPSELLGIYQKTVPEAVVKLVLRLVNLDIVPMIEAFYASFPPKSTHVSIQPRDEKLPSAGPVKVLVLNEDIEAGQIIYTEHPMLTSLDFDLQAAGTHCFQCFKELSDPVSLTSAAGDKALFCSTKCQNAAKSQWHSFLFTVDPPIPGVPEFAQLAPTPEGLEARREAQSKFAAYLNKDQKAVSSLVAKFIARQLTAAGQPHAEDDYAQADGAQKYAIEDYVERWTTGKGEPSEEEFGLLVNLMRNTLPGLEAFLPQDGHKSLCGKLAFNAFGVTFGEGREDRPASTHRPENTEITRTAAGTERQTGTALYSISTYLPHSCEPNARATFPNGTSELHLVAAKDLKKGDVLSVAYVDVTQKADESASDCRLRRRKEIARGWKFPCECSRCLAEAQAQN